MRYLTLLALLFVCAKWQLIAESPKSPLQKKPNVIIIYADDLGYGDLSCYGAVHFNTPACDRLAKEGMKFTDAHSSSAVCTPSRYSLLTGRYNWRSWLKNWVLMANHPLLIDTKRLTLPKVFKKAAYTTGCVGKWHLGWGSNKGADFNKPLMHGPLEVGFDTFFGVPHSHNSPPALEVYIRDRRIVNLPPGMNYKDAKVQKLTRRKLADTAIDLSQEAVKFIEKNKHRPFFLYYPTTNIHFPLTPNSQFKNSTGAGVYGDFIVEFDWAVGQVLKTLDKHKLSDNTIVIVTSDNGARPHESLQGHACNGPWRGTKRHIYESGHRVPFIIRWPGVVKAGTVSAETICQTDLLATFARIAGVSLPADAAEDSYDLTDLLKGKKYTQPLREATVHHSVAGQFALRQGDWKLIEGSGSGDYPRNSKEKIDIKSFTPQYDSQGHIVTLDYFRLKPDGKFQLYNLKKDPRESQDLSSVYPEKVKQMYHLLNRYRTHSRSAKE